ncbi:hypothetical protein GGR51DRAFT_256960 [Nemania sp. FL0031]|nr:hypothetical protein GGR51DRAFT_256960 [Nemania sp. FL0031]
MATDVERLGATMLADISALVSKRLREEYLYAFIRSRDGFLRQERPDDSETLVMLRAQCLSTLDTTWDGALQIFRSELPKAVDQVLSDMKPKLSAERRSPSPYDDPSIASPLVSEALDVSQTTGSQAMIRFRPLSPSTKDGEPGSAAAELASSALALADKPSRKRALDPKESIPEPSKLKAKRTRQIRIGAPSFKSPIKRTISRHDLADEEYIFSYDGYPGDYVLRCNQVQCKKHFYQDGPTIFTSDPFKDRRGLEHFGGTPHNMHSETAIFRKFALRVLTRKTEGNSKKKDDPSPDGSLLLGDDPTPQPTSPNKSKDKGKQPERPYDLYRPAATMEEASTSVLALDIARTAMVHGAVSMSDDSDDSGDLPPLEDAIRRDTN